MKTVIRSALMLALVVSLAATSAMAMVTSHGPPNVIHLQRNVTRIDQRALVFCTRNCTNVHKLEVDTCNALGSSFKGMRLRNQSEARMSYATIGKCVSSASNKLRDCKTLCKTSVKMK